MAEELLAWFGTNLPGCNCDSADADLVTGLRHVDGVFEKDDWVVLGEGYYAATAELLGRSGDGVGGGCIGEGVDLP